MSYYSIITTIFHEILIKRIEMINPTEIILHANNKIINHRKNNYILSPKILKKIENVLDHCLNANISTLSMHDYSHILNWIQWTMEMGHPKSIQSLIRKGYKVAYYIFETKPSKENKILYLELYPLKEVVGAILSGFKVKPDTIINCVIQGRVDILFFLQTIGINIDIRDSAQQPILPFLAIKYNETEVLKFLIDEKFPLNEKYNFIHNDINYYNVDLLFIDAVFNPHSITTTEILLPHFHHKNPTYPIEITNRVRDHISILEYLAHEYIQNEKYDFEKIKLYFDHLCHEKLYSECMNLFINILTLNLHPSFVPRSKKILEFIENTVINYNEQFFSDYISKYLSSQYYSFSNCNPLILLKLKSFMNNQEQIWQEALLHTWCNLKNDHFQILFLNDFPEHLWKHNRLPCLHNFFYWMSKLYTNQKEKALTNLQQMVSPVLLIHCMKKGYSNEIATLFKEVFDENKLTDIIRDVIRFYFLDENNFDKNKISFFISFLDPNNNKHVEMIHELGISFLENEQDEAFRKLCNFFLKEIWLKLPRTSVSQDNHWYIRWKALHTHRKIKNIKPNIKYPHDYLIGIELFRRKVISHITQIPGECSFLNVENKTVNIEYEGFSKCDRYFFKVLQKGLAKTIKILDKETKKFFKNSKELDIYKLHQRITEGEPCSYPSGFTGHSIEVLFYGNFLVFIDTGIFLEKYAFHIYRIDKNKITLELLQKLRDMRFYGGSLEQLETLINDLIVILNGKKHQSTIASFGEKEFLHKQQIDKHCTWTCKEAALYHFLRLKDLKEVAYTKEWNKKLNLTYITKEFWLLKHKKTERIFYKTLSTCLLRFLDKEIAGILNKTFVLVPDLNFLKRVLEAPLLNVPEEDENKYLEMYKKIHHLYKN